ncbi:hypothetical protein CDAR_305331 [Caerostris darwini]|uniref:Uncharacterized protein n=1 Tax=Caerostris darwini TaxID=1538125 RepID=A0AAV4MB71_9ARAC|nr:hypothetical protein CDAR_305331 [Caerostris darwini]
MDASISKVQATFKILDNLANLKEAHLQLKTDSQAIDKEYLESMNSYLDALDNIHTVCRNKSERDLESYLLNIRHLKGIIDKLIEFMHSSLRENALQLENLEAGISDDYLPKIKFEPDFISALQVFDERSVFLADVLMPQIVKKISHLRSLCTTKRN